MKLNSKIVLLLAGLFAILGGIQYIIGERILLRGFDQLEQQSAFTDMDRVSNAIQRDLDALYEVAEDYGNWKETYQFMQTGDVGYLRKDFSDDSIATLKINVAAFIAKDGHFVWSTAREAGATTPLPLDLVAGRRLPAGTPWLNLLGTSTKNTTGIIKTNQGPLLAVLAPILDGSGSGEPRGMILFGRLLTDDVIARIGRQSQVSLSLVALEGATPDDASSLGTLIRNPEETIVQRTFRDALGEDLFRLQIRVPRAISASGREVVSMAWLLMGGGFILVLLLIIIVLRETILKPLGMVTHHTVAIGQSDDLTTRLDLRRADEIGDLAREFDRMVARLSDTRQQLISQSFDAGVAENASGVLHNLGNAMTPLGVKISAIGKQLRSAPTADAGLVLAELKKEVTDPARHAELTQFLQLVSGELTQTISDTVFELETVTRQVAAMQNMLQAQARNSTAPRVMETLRVPELVATTRELIAPELSHAMDIEVDEALRALGPIRVCRITLQQVIQNVLVNAAEAIQARGLRSGTLRISGTVIQAGAGESVCIRFADNGIGMSAEQLSRFAEKGFSSKAGSHGRGVGLHWAANALHALGGSLRAESAGRDCGASILVTIPFERVPAAPARRVA